MKKILLALFFLSTNVFANGELHISSQSILPRIVPKEGINIPVLKLNLTAKNETVYIDKLLFERTGLSSSQDVKSIRATGTNIRSRSFPVLTNDIATIRFFKKLIIPANTTQVITIVANLDIQGVGRTIGLDLIEIVSSADETSFDAQKKSPIVEKVSKASSVEKRIIEIEKLDFTPSRLRLERWKKLGRFRLRNFNKQSVELGSLYLKNNGIGSLDSIFHNIIITSKNSIVSYSTKISDRSAHISFLNGTNIDGNSNRLIDIWGKVKRNKSNYSIDLRIENEDIMSN